MNSFHISFNHFFKPTRKWLVLFASFFAILLLSGCAETGQMNYQPRFDPLSATTLFANGASAQPIVPNTVSYSADNSVNSPINTGLDANGKPIQGFPEPVTEALVSQGQQRYNIYCTPCHGPSGKGDGKAVTFGFPKPPSFLSDDIASAPNTDVFNAITNGFQKMFSYGYRVKPPERWAIIAYIRALQLKNGPVNPQDLTPTDLDQIGKHP
jgi:mono/diheme cytochrome c family protein